MKKIFSLLCATLLVFSANAAPVAQKAQLVKKAPVAVEQMQKVQFEKVQTATLQSDGIQLEPMQTSNENQLSATPALTVSNQKAQVPAILGKKVVKEAKQKAAFQAAAPAKAPQATQAEHQSHEVVASDFSMVDYGTDMYMTALDAAGNKFFFDVYYTGSFELGKTYTLADMDPDYSWYKLASGDGNAYTEASITVTKDQDGLLHVVAAVVLDNGDSYEITYDEKAFVPTGVQINVNATNYKAQYISYYGEYVYTASNTDFDIALWVYTDTELGTFDEDVDIEGSYLQEAGGGDYVIFHSVATPIVVAQDEDGNKSLTGSLYDKNGDEYVLNLVYEKPAVETATAIVEDAKLTKTSQFFHVDGNDTEGAYGVTLYVVTKNLEGEFTVEDLDVYSSGVTDLSVKKWFDIDSCEIVSEMLGSNTLVISGLLHTSNEQLGRLIDLTFIMTARVDANGELMDIYGGIVSPAKGDTISLTRSEKGTAFFKNPSTGGLAFGDQSGKTTMVAVNDSAYYWYNPISKLTTGYWIKGIKDKEANTINFDTAQVINVYNGGLLGLMKWMKATTQGKITIATDGANQFVLDINEDTLTLHGSAPFDFTQDVFFPGVVVPGYGFQGYGDAGTILTLNKPITERDTVTVTADMKIAAEPAKGIIKVSAELNDTTFILEVVGADTVGTFSLADGTLSQKYYYGIVSAAGRSDFAEGEVTIAKNETGLKLNGLMIGVDEKAYVLDWTYTPITERDTVKVNLEAITVQEDVNSTTQAHRGWLYVGVDTDTETQYIVQVLGTEQLGTFSYANGTLGSNYYNVIAGSSRQQFTEGEVTIAEDEEGLKLTGLLIGEDEKAYALNWIQPAGRLQYDTDAPFEATFAYSDMEATLDNGVIGIYATNAENLTIGLELYTDPTATTIPAGTYVISDTQEAGTALQSLGVAGGYLTECWAGVRAASGGISDCWFMVEGTITLSYDEYGKLKVEVDAKNSYGQPVTALIAYEKIEPKKTVDFTDAELYVYDGYVEKYGIMNFYGGNADGYKFDLYAYADTIAGDFLEAIDFGDCELTSPAGSIGVIDAYEFKVERDGKNLTLTAKVLGSDTVQYNITATGYLGYIGGDAKEAYEGEFAIEEIAAQQVAISKVNYIYIQGQNAAGDKFALVVEGEMEDEAIAAGEYTEVLASTGYDAQEQLNPSFVTDADNNDWFIQSGKLTVYENGAMYFEGLNSYDKNVIVTIGDVPAPAVTDYYLVGWINNAAYGIEGDIDNFGDYHFVDGKVKATFNELSYVQVKDNNKQIYGTAAYVTPTDKGSAILVANGAEKVAINGGVEYEYTLVVNEDGTLTLNYEVVKTALDNINAGKKASKAIKNGMIVIEKNGKAYNVLGIAL